MPAVLLALVLAAAEAAPSADPLMQSLPADGAWVSFHVTLNVAGLELSPVWTIRSVGTKTVAGQPHRWVELQSQLDGRNEVVWKLLVSETEFRPSHDALAKPAEAWVQFGDGDPERVGRIADRDPLLDLIGSGPTKDVRRLDEKEPVDWQRGRLDCAVTVGESAGTLGRRPIAIGGLTLTIPNAEVTVRHRIRRHPDVPFGVAASRQDFKVTLAGNTYTGHVEFSLKDHGKDATSALPDVK